MKKLIILFILLVSKVTFAETDIVGYWTTIDDETGESKSIVRIYEDNGKYFGRVVELFKNKQAKAKIGGSPNILGLDIIWNLKANGDKYTDGKILDPQKGKVYGCEIWRQGDNLIVRGKIAFLGRNQTWKQAKAPNLVDQKLIPQIPIKD